MNEQTQNFIKFLEFVDDQLDEVMLAIVEDEDLDAAYIIGSLTSAITHKIYSLDPDRQFEDEEE